MAAPTSISDAHRTYLGTRYFAPLDGLRCISIVSVIGLHAFSIQHAIFGRGGLGVELFFVISGYLITTLLLREQAKHGAVSLRAFYVRRTVRIFPLYFAVLGCYLALVLLMERDTAAGRAFLDNFPAFLTYTSNWFVPLDNERVIFYFAWSLATEEQFYLFWPLVVAAAVSRSTPLRVITLLLFVDLGLEFLIAAGALDLGATPNRILTSLATPICMGCILAYWLHEERTFGRVYRVLGRAWSLPAALLALAAAYALPGTPDLVIYLAMVATVGAACIRPDPQWRGLLANRVAAFVGTISYGMYLLHMLALNTARRLPIPEGWPEFLIGLAITIVAAWASFRWFETPFLALKERYGRTQPVSGLGVAGVPATLPGAPQPHGPPA